MTEEAGQSIRPEPSYLMTGPPTHGVTRREEAHDVDELAAWMQATSIRASAYPQETYVAEQPTVVDMQSRQAPAYVWPSLAGTSPQPALESDPGFSSGAPALLVDGYAGGWQDTALEEQDDYEEQPAVS